LVPKILVSYPFKNLDGYIPTQCAGDDCVSIQTGCSNIYIHNVNCGPGHGISIGGLGKENTKACVSNVTVRDVMMHNTMNGVRIKTWQVEVIFDNHKLPYFFELNKKPLSVSVSITFKPVSIYFQFYTSYFSNKFVSISF